MTLPKNQKQLNIETTNQITTGVLMKIKTELDSIVFGLVFLIRSKRFVTEISLMYHSSKSILNRADSFIGQKAINLLSFASYGRYSNKETNGICMEATCISSSGTQSLIHYF